MAATQEILSTHEPAEILPRKFDRYLLLKKIATGGMAEIYLAKQSGLEGFEKVVVLKRILSHLAQDEEFVSMFLDEARIAAKLSHPNIVQIYDLGKADDTYYIAMEYVSGRNVQHLVAKQQERGETIPVEHVVRIVAGVCDGLFYAHSRKDYNGQQLNIVHRDISPQNVLVSLAGGVKVVDFGIAKASTQLAQTRAGVLKGKYAYMSPEQVKGAKIDHRSDIFAVGLVMYEMLTGQRAFERESSLKTLKAIVQEKPLNPRELNPEIPMDVVKLLSKALEKNPDKRYKTAQEMQLALEEYLETSPKKSNNVRLSRFMYDVFDDELSSKAGTLLDEDLGEIVIPVPAGAKIEPMVEEDVDHHTLSQALAPAVEDVAAKNSGPRPGVSKPREASPPPVDDDPDDGLTLPAADLDEVMRRGEAKAQARAGARARPANPQGALTSFEADDALAPRGDAQAAALLAKVEAMAAADNAETRAALAAVLDPAMRAATGPLMPAESMIVGPNGRVSAAPDGIRPPARIARPGDSAQQTPAPAPPRRPTPEATRDFVSPPSHSTQRELGQRESGQREPGQRELVPRDADTQRTQRAPAAARSVAAQTAGVVAGLLFLSCIIGTVAIALLLPAAGKPVEFGAVTIATVPAGARVMLDGDDMLVGVTPLQLVVPLVGEHVAELTLEGHKRVLQPFAFSADAVVADVNVRLEPTP